MSRRASGQTRPSGSVVFVVILVFLVTSCVAVSSSRPSASVETAATPSPRATAEEGAASSSASSASPAPSTTSVVESGTPIFLIVFENKDAAEIYAGIEAPYTASLARDYAHAANFHAITYPSQPNYIALWSGSTQGVSDNELHDIDAPNLADQIEAAGRSWRVYAENYPGGCFTGAFSMDGADGDGIYSRKHNPAISFTSISGDPERCASITDLSQFDPEAADFSLIVPNNCHSMHDCPIADGDAWLARFLPRILDSDAYRSGGTVFITFDEDRGDGDNHIATIVVSEHARRGAASDVPYTHYSLLRTIQEMLGLPCLAESCRAEPMRDLLDLSW